MAALMAASKHRRKGKTRPRGKPPRMPLLPAWWSEDDEAGDINEGDLTNVPPAAEDLRDWQPHIVREPDPRQGELFAGRDNPAMLPGDERNRRRSVPDGKSATGRDRPADGGLGLRARPYAT
jgi:hypothetical protein